MLETRGALYYPYIHPRDVDWVKGTLLCFGQIQRIVPDGFALNDPPEIAFLRDFPGPRNEPLLRSISPEHNGIEAAERRLHHALARVPTAELESRFGYASTVRDYQSPNVFEIHEDKFQHALLNTLQGASLAWRHRNVKARGRWWCVHPELGTALMSVIAIAAARDEGLDVVTEQMAMHHALAALDEESVLEQLLQGPQATTPTATQSQATDQLAHVVLTAMFDLSAIPMHDVAELVRDGHDLGAFKAAISDLAMSVPAGASPERRNILLTQQAELVIELWQKQKRGWPRRLLDAIRQGSSDDAKSAAMSAAAELTKAATTGTIAALAGGAALNSIALPALAGLGVSAIVAVGGGLLSGRERGPFHYLTQVTRAGASLMVTPKRPWKDREAKADLPPN